MFDFNFILNSRLNKVELEYSDDTERDSTKRNVTITKSKSGKITELSSTEGEIWLFDSNKSLFFSATKFKEGFLVSFSFEDFPCRSCLLCYTEFAESETIYMKPKGILITETFNDNSFRQIISKNGVELYGTETNFDLNDQIKTIDYQRSGLTQFEIKNGVGYITRIFNKNGKISKEIKLNPLGEVILCKFLYNRNGQIKNCKTYINDNFHDEKNYFHHFMYNKLNRFDRTNQSGIHRFYNINDELFFELYLDKDGIPFILKYNTFNYNSENDTDKITSYTPKEDRWTQEFITKSYTKDIITEQTQLFVDDDCYSDIEKIRNIKGIPLKTIYKIGEYSSATEYFYSLKGDITHAITTDSEDGKYLTYFKY